MEGRGHGGGREREQRSVLSREQQPQGEGEGAHLGNVAGPVLLIDRAPAVICRVIRERASRDRQVWSGANTAHSPTVHCCIVIREGASRDNEGATPNPNNSSSIPCGVILVEGDPTEGQGRSVAYNGPALPKQRINHRIHDSAIADRHGRFVEQEVRGLVAIEQVVCAGDAAGGSPERDCRNKADVCSERDGVSILETVGRRGGGGRRQQEQRNG